jgi:hypothetical protein
MDNPFKKRATEYFDDPMGLLSLVSAEPIRRFFKDGYEELFDRSVIVVGTPGSGKTTLAQLLEFDTLVALVKSIHNNDNKKLATELTQLKILHDLFPTLLAFRLPASSSLRDIWELPYSSSVRFALLRSFIQARAVLGWLRKLEKMGAEVDKIKIITREHLATQSELIHADNVIEFRNYARNVEERVFNVVTALVPPKEEDLVNIGISTTYEAFDVIEGIVVPPIVGLNTKEIKLRPLFILDDAHELHPDQFSKVEAWLRQREFKVARWILTRVDAIGTDDLRKALINDVSPSNAPGTTHGRDRVIKLMQKTERTSTDRRAFRAIARDIARRYLEQMPVLRRHFKVLEDCLLTSSPSLTPSNYNDLCKKINTLKVESGFSESRLRQLESAIPVEFGQDIRQAVFRILLHREIRRSPQTELFAVEVDIPEPEEELKTIKNSALVTGAAIQLYHEYERPIYFSFDRLADASSENIEQFINLAGSLVDTIETRLLRGNDPRLDPKIQHQTLVRRATEAIKGWNFPHSEGVRKLVLFIATRCKLKTLSPNAPLDDGANAFGILQSEMTRFQETPGTLKQVLHYALAYNALSLVENYPCKLKVWCLFELGGLPTLVHGLTLNRGGFCEGRLDDLISCIEEK